MNQMNSRPSAEKEELSAFLCSIGDKVRMLRGQRSISRKKLSQISGVSERYLAQLESGAGNISVAFLYRISKALGVQPQDLLSDQPTKKKMEHSIALIGLRGAGKSTLGRRLADCLSLDFVELNTVIEEQSGMPVSEVIALYGQEGYRELESKALDALVDRSNRIVLAVGGGIVSSPPTFATLRHAFRTVWLKASPEEHMERVRAQGDSRPMAGNPGAMAELKRILTSREDMYQLADATVDTSGKSIENNLEQLVALFR
jgi:XRE family transcriptional regulator, aerobic/anaerobic benzoate catabolism transcriptional regulator